MRITPDGHRYLTRYPPSPFHLRWLAPKVCGDSEFRWNLLTRVSLLAIGVLTALLGHQHGLGLWPSLAAGALVLGLPSVKFLLNAPVLVDAPAMALALGSACAIHNRPLGMVLALLAGATSERAPVFAALFAWNPLPLVGLVATGWIAILRTPGFDVLDERNAWILVHPLKASREFHRGQWRNPALMLAPWGACLAGLIHPTVALVGCVAVAYSQLLVATDTVRLYQWAAPALAIAAAGVFPESWLLLVVLAHWANPVAGPGI